MRAGLLRISDEKFKELSLYLLKGSTVTCCLFLNSVLPLCAKLVSHTHLLIVGRKMPESL